MLEKAKKYLAWFLILDEAKKKLVDEGTLDKQEYKRWRRTAIFQGRETYAMVDVLATDLTNVDLLAASIINGYMPEVYAVNVNWTEYIIEKQLNASTSFTLFNEAAVERLIREKPDLIPKARVDIPKDLQWNKQHLTSAITQGIIQGETTDQVAKRLAEVSDMDHRAAVRNAATMTTSAQNGGRMDTLERAKNMGIAVKKRWIATLDGLTRPTHRICDGEIRETGKKFSNGLEYPGDPKGPPSEIYNCFVGETQIASDSEVVRSYKHKYNGELYTVKTACGVQFTCTPNHPILTPRGWVAVKFLNRGEDILIARRVNNIIGRVYPNINHTLPRMDAFHEFLNKFGSKRTRLLGVNFHGDIPTSDVEIVTQKRLLRNTVDSVIEKVIDKGIFKLPNSSLESKGATVKHLRGVMPASFRFIGGKSKPLPFGEGGVSHAVIHRLRAIARRNSGSLKPAVYNASVDTKFGSEGFDRLPCSIFADKIVDVKVDKLCTHVYNLQTGNGRYFVNSSIPHSGDESNSYFAIAHNCRCIVTAVVDRQQTNLSDRDTRELERWDISYDEWKETKGQSRQNITRAHKNANRDLKMYKEYKSLLGKKVPGRFKDFQELKYKRTNEWRQMVSAARKARNKRRAANGL